MIKRIIAEVLSALSAVLMAAFAAAILGGMVGVIFVPMFLIGGFVFYFFVRAWMHDVFELKYQKNPGGADTTG